MKATVTDTDTIGLSSGIPTVGGQLTSATAGKITNASVPFTPASMTFTRQGKLPRYFKRLSEIGKKVLSLQPAYDYSAYTTSNWTRTAFPTTCNSTWTDDGIYTISYNIAGGFKHVMPTGPVYPYCHIEANITATGSAGTYNRFGIGLMSSLDGSKKLVAEYDAKSLTVSIKYDTGSGLAVVPTLSTYTAATYTLGSPPAAGALFEFTLTGRTVTVHIAGQHIMSKDIKAAIDMRHATTGISLYSWGFYMQSDGVGNTMAISGDIKSGYFGATGMTDYRMVKDVYGNTYQDAQGLVYFTADVQGYQCTYGTASSISGWDSTHSAVFSLDPRTGDYKEVGKIFPTYVNNTQSYPSGYSPTSYTVPYPGGAGGAVGGTDSALIYDPSTLQWTLLSLPSILDVAPYVMYYSQFSDANPLRGIVQPQMSIFNFTQPTDVPSGDEQETLNASAFKTNDGNWNVFVTARGKTGRWYQGPTLASLTRISSNTGSYQEGCCTLRVGDRNYVLFTRGSNNLAAYGIDTGVMVSLGTVTLTPAVPIAGVFPWPCLFEYRHNGKTEFYGLFFSSDDYGQQHMTAGDTFSGGNVCAWTAGTPFLYKDLTHTITGDQSPLQYFGF